LRNLSREEVADRTGVPVDYVKELFQEFSEEVRASTPVGERQEKVKEMYKQGFQPKRLSAIFRIPLHIIDQWVGRGVELVRGKNDFERDVGGEKLPSFKDIFNSRHNKP